MARLLILLVVAFSLSASDTAASLADQIRGSSFDPQECYRVRDLHFAREDLRFYLTEGHLMFGKPVAGRVISALFTADVEGGDAELILMPPSRSERLSLATFTRSPNLNEHFRAAVLLFTDDTAAVLAEQIRSRGEPRRSAEAGVLLAQSWDSVLRNISSSLGIRLVYDLIAGAPAARGLFYSAVSGNRLGNFDALCDRRAAEQIHAGRLSYRDDRAFFDTWTSFPARPTRTGVAAPPPDFTLGNFRIQAALDSDLHLKAVTQATLTAHAGGLRVLGLDIAARVRITAAHINGEPAEVFQRESLRANLVRGSDNEMFLVVPPQPLEAGRHYEIVLEHEGDVVTKAGARVFYVGARGTWYPKKGLDFAQYDLTFTYPAELDLVFPGDLQEDRREGSLRTTRRKTASPIRAAGFNLGDYRKVRVAGNGYAVEVFANRTLEDALVPKARHVVIIPPVFVPWPRPQQQRRPEVIAFTAPEPSPDPGARLESLASEVASAYEFFVTHFGPPPMKTLMVSPIPASFGQGFAGLIYLSTLAYMDPAARPAALRGQFQQTFFSEILHAHETAHQWWGNTVTSASYQDDWLMEALANYSALLLVEKKKGAEALRDILGQYRAHLLTKDQEGRTLESAGPIRWGLRLRSSHVPGSWQPITYEKGSWILHMLRRRLGDEKFLAMLGELCRRYRYQAVTTDQFRTLAAGYLPPDSPDPALETFFELWVNGTGIPSLKLSWSVKGKAPLWKLSGTLTQSDVEDDFGVLVPVEIQLGRGRSLTQWIRTASDPVSFTVNLRQSAVKVLLDPQDSVLASRK